MVFLLCCVICGHISAEGWPVVIALITKRACMWFYIMTVYMAFYMTLRGKLQFASLTFKFHPDAPCLLLKCFCNPDFVWYFFPHESHIKLLSMRVTCSWNDSSNAFTSILYKKVIGAYYSHKWWKICKSIYKKRKTYGMLWYRDVPLAHIVFIPSNNRQSHLYLKCHFNSLSYVHILLRMVIINIFKKK